jgi:hypothetical protein
MIFILINYLILKNFISCLISIYAKDLFKNQDYLVYQILLMTFWDVENHIFYILDYLYGF